jgi:RimJ/RimL family protein N-acetyltransferase
MAIGNIYLRAECSLSDEIIESGRLRLRPFEAKDAEAFWLMRSSPAVMEYIPWDVATDKSAMYQEYADALALGERFKFFRAVEWKTLPPGGKYTGNAHTGGDNTGTQGFMIGWVLFRPTEDGRFVELGYWFLPEAWGQGLATEASKAMVEGHRAAVGVPLADIYAAVFVGNDASRRVLEKVGLEVTAEGIEYGKPTWELYWKK